MGLQLEAKYFEDSVDSERLEIRLTSFTLIGDIMKVHIE